MKPPSVPAPVPVIAHLYSPRSEPDVFHENAPALVNVGGFGNNNGLPGIVGVNIGAAIASNASVVTSVMGTLPPTTSFTVLATKFRLPTTGGGSTTPALISKSVKLYEPPRVSPI